MRGLLFRVVVEVILTAIVWLRAVWMDPRFLFFSLLPYIITETQAG